MIALGGMVKSAFSGIVAPIAQIFQKREDRKAAVARVQGKVSEAKIKGSATLRMSDREWEMVSKGQEAGTWKDEYVTIVISVPLLTMFAGAALMGWAGDGRLLEATRLMFREMETAPESYWSLLTVVFLAAVGVKAFKRLF